MTGSAAAPEPFDDAPPADRPGAERLRHSLFWRRDFLARLLPDLEQGRLRTGDGGVDLTEVTVHSLRLRLAEIEAQLEKLDQGEDSR